MKSAMKKDNKKNQKRVTFGHNSKNYDGGRTFFTYKKNYISQDKAHLLELDGIHVKDSLREGILVASSEGCNSYRNFKHAIIQQLNSSYEYVQQNAYDPLAHPEHAPIGELARWRFEVLRQAVVDQTLIPKKLPHVFSFCHSNVSTQDAFYKAKANHEFVLELNKAESEIERAKAFASFGLTLLDNAIYSEIYDVAEPVRAHYIAQLNNFHYNISQKVENIKATQNVVNHARAIDDAIQVVADEILQKACEYALNDDSDNEQRLLFLHTEFLKNPHNIPILVQLSHEGFGMEYLEKIKEFKFEQYTQQLMLEVGAEADLALRQANQEAESILRQINSQSNLLFAFKKEQKLHEIANKFVKDVAKFIEPLHKIDPQSAQEVFEYELAKEGIARP